MVVTSIGALITFIGGMMALADVFGEMYFSLLNIFTTKPYIHSKNTLGVIRKIGIKLLLLGVIVSSVGILCETDFANALKQTLQ